MFEFINLWYYKDGAWDEIDPTGMTVSTILSLSSTLLLVMKDNNDVYHALNYSHLDNLMGTEDFITQVNTLVLNSPIEKVPEFSTSTLVEITNVELKDGLVRIPDITPFVFNSTTSFYTEPFNGGSMVLDYLDNVFSTNDVTLGYISNITDFKLDYLTSITMENIHAALLVVGNTLTKVSDYFTARGNTVYPKAYKTEALMSLLIEANISPMEIGVSGPYKSGIFKSRLVTSRLIKHPDLKVLIHPNNTPVELYKSVVNTTLPYSTQEIIFRGNKPSTLKALGLLSGDQYSPKAITEDGVHLSLPVDESVNYYQVSVRYPSLNYLASI